MVRTLLFTIILLSSLNFADAQEYYYWAYGKKYPLELHSGKQYVLVQGQNKASITQGLGVSEQNISNLKPIVISRTINRSRQNIPGRDSLYWSFINHSIDKDKIKSSDIIYAAPSFLVNGKEIGLSQYFYVKLKYENDLKLCNYSGIKFGDKFEVLKDIEISFVERVNNRPDDGEILCTFH